MQAELLKLIENFDVISFDVFDTLLLRSYLTQEDLWRDLGRRELGEREASAFLKARIAADKKTYDAATRRGGEHRLSEAYSLMPNRFAELELKEELLQRECLAANPEMLEAWKRAGELGKKRIIVSDMYLSEAWFAETLKKNGFGDYDALYVSSERQTRKSTGKLFEIVSRDFAGQRILHIGDNVHSDVKMADRAGLTACHYENLRDEVFSRCPFLSAYMSNWPSFEKRLQVGTLVRGYKLAKGNEKSYWWRLGYFFGGVLGHLYVSWLAERAKARRIEHLMFVARDGYLWKQMFDSLNTGIMTDYFYAPRMTSVKVCGVIGTDPNAKEERQRILDSLSNNDPEAERLRYQEYIKQFEISDKTAIVDGCSSAFSVQCLVEKSVRRHVPTFYLMSLSPLSCGDALFPKCTGDWQMLSEFLFSSPEAPIDDIDANGPKYREGVLSDERFRQSVFADVAAGATFGFSLLSSSIIAFSRQDWLDYFSVFQQSLTDDDMQFLSKAKNAWQINQENFLPIINKRVFVRVTKRMGIRLGTWRGRSTMSGYVESFYLLGRYLLCSKIR